ncbi:MAG: hypothetical protein WBA31_06375, partial [Candidatus Dormiibacterota bacterium]
MAPYSEAELTSLKLLRSAFSWNIGLDRRSGIWVATYGDERIRRDDPLNLFDALTLAAWARRANLPKDDRERADTEPGYTMGCDCCQERLEQLAAAIHEANSRILAEPETARKDVAELSTLVRRQITANDLQLWRLLEGREVKSRASEEAGDQGGPVLHPAEPGLDQLGQLGDVAPGQVGEGPLEHRPDPFSRFVIVHGSLERRVRARRLSAERACSGWWSGPDSCGHAGRSEAGRQGRCGRGHLLRMVAVTSVPDGELWRSFPDAVRSDILGVLGMLLERWAVSAGLAAEG